MADLGERGTVVLTVAKVSLAISESRIAWADSAPVSFVRPGRCLPPLTMTTDRIEIDPNVMMGKPVIRGTRIKVELLLRKLAEGATEDELLDAYPRLTREDIRAAIA